LNGSKKLWLPWVIIREWLFRIINKNNKFPHSDCFPVFNIHVYFKVYNVFGTEELGGRAVSALSVRSRKISIVSRGSTWMGDQYYLELLRASEGTLSCWSRLHLQSIASTPVSRTIAVRQAASRKIWIECRMPNMPNLYHYMMKTCCTDPT
jgi:hypothetical protein